jgi:hypothetical protein
MNALVACIVLLTADTHTGKLLVPHTNVQLLREAGMGRVIVHIGEQDAQTVTNGEEFMNQYVEAVEKCNIAK